MFDYWRVTVTSEGQGIAISHLEFPAYKKTDFRGKLSWKQNNTENPQVPSSIFFVINEHIIRLLGSFILSFPPLFWDEDHPLTNYNYYGINY